MANDKDLPEVEEKTFYLYDYSNLLVTRAKKIYSPYNVKTLWRTPSEDYFNDPDSVEFKNGQYTARIDRLWPIKYKQQLEWLSFYNTTGWQLSKWRKDLHQGHLNGRWFKNDWIHKIHIQEINNTPKPEVETKTEIVEMQQIPAIVAGNMNVLQLRELAAEWKVELPEDILQWWDVDKIQSSIIETMTLAGHIK